MGLSPHRDRGDGPGTQILPPVGDAGIASVLPPATGSGTVMPGQKPPGRFRGAGLSGRVISIGGDPKRVLAGEAHPDPSKQIGELVHGEAE